MSNELADLLDEALRDLDEAGFAEEADWLYTLAYEQDWADTFALAGGIGRDVMRIHARLGETLPPSATTSLTRLMEIVRRYHPDISPED